MRLGDTPVPIPNTMVKTQAADGTILETVWESRWLPDLQKITIKCFIYISRYKMHENACFIRYFLIYVKKMCNRSIPATMRLRRTKFILSAFVRVRNSVSNPPCSIILAAVSRC